MGSLLNLGVTWDDIGQALSEGDLEFVEHNQSSVLAAIAASVHRLTEDEQHRYQELVIFPRSEPLQPPVVARLWARTGGLKGTYSRKLLTKLRSRALLKSDLTFTTCSTTICRLSWNRRCANIYTLCLLVHISLWQTRNLRFYIHCRMMTVAMLA